MVKIRVCVVFLLLYLQNVSDAVPAKRSGSKSSRLGSWRGSKFHTFHEGQYIMRLLSESRRKVEASETLLHLEAEMWHSVKDQMLMLVLQDSPDAIKFYSRNATTVESAEKISPAACFYVVAGNDDFGFCVLISTLLKQSYTELSELVQKKWKNVTPLSMINDPDENDHVNSDCRSLYLKELNRCKRKKLPQHRKQCIRRLSRRRWKRMTPTNKKMFASSMQQANRKRYKLLSEFRKQRRVCYKFKSNREKRESCLEALRRAEHFSKLNEFRSFERNLARKVRMKRRRMRMRTKFVEQKNKCESANSKKFKIKCIENLLKQDRFSVLNEFKNWKIQTQTNPEYWNVVKRIELQKQTKRYEALLRSFKEAEGGELPKRKLIQQRRLWTARLERARQIVRQRASINSKTRHFVNKIFRDALVAIATGRANPSKVGEQVLKIAEIASDRPINLRERVVEKNKQKKLKEAEKRELENALEIGHRLMKKLNGKKRKEVMEMFDLANRSLLKGNRNAKWKLMRALKRLKGSLKNKKHKMTISNAIQMTKNASKTKEKKTQNRKVLRKAKNLIQKLKKSKLRWNNRSKKKLLKLLSLLKKKKSKKNRKMAKVLLKFLNNKKKREKKELNERRVTKKQNTKKLRQTSSKSSKRKRKKNRKIGNRPRHFPSKNIRRAQKAQKGGQVKQKVKRQGGKKAKNRKTTRIRQRKMKARKGRTKKKIQNRRAPNLEHSKLFSKKNKRELGQKQKRGPKQKPKHVRKASRKSKRSRNQKRKPGRKANRKSKKGRKRKPKRGRKSRRIKRSGRWLRFNARRKTFLQRISSWIRTKAPSLKPLTRTATQSIIFVNLFDGKPGRFS